MRKISFLPLIILCCTGVSLSAQEAGPAGIESYRLSQDINTGSDLRIQQTDLEAGDIEKNAQLKHLVYDKNKKMIRLQETELIEDDAPAAGVPEGYRDYLRGPVEWVEDLRKGIVIKKILEVANPAAASARLVFKGMEVKGNTETLYLSINGTKFERPASRIAYPHARQYIDMTIDRWFYVDLPADKLRKGKNEIQMWTESDSTSWRILIAHAKEFKRGSLTRTEHPNRSMKSKDGGKSFSDSRLGAMDEIDGEYSVRLSLDHYLPSGVYVSPLIDVVDGDDPLKSIFKNLKVSLLPDFDMPANTSIKAFVRFGAGPSSDDPSWTSWQAIERGREYSPGDKRYMQWRAELSTGDPLASPLVRRMHIKAVYEDHSTNKKTGVIAHVVNNGEIVQHSYPFSYENLNHIELKKFREDHKLDQVVAGAKSEFEVMMKLLNWAYRVPITLNAYSWNWNDVTVTPVIEEGTGMPKLNGPFFKGRRMVGMCLYPNQALIGALLSMGYQARHINIHSEAMSGHEVTEVWSNEYNKWIYMDATRDYYYYDLQTGIPLNLLEIHRLLAAQMPRAESWQRPFVPDIGQQVVAGVKVGMRQGNNPFSIEEGGGLYILETMGHFRIIPRNDFLSKPLPVPVHTGDTMWGWDGFVNWYDDVFGKRDEYQTYSNRMSDFYQPLNQAKVYLNETDKPGVLQVRIDAFIPGGKGSFLLSTDNVNWTELNTPDWTWNLKSGVNNILVRTKNSRDILGPVSNLQVTYNP